MPYVSLNPSVNKVMHTYPSWDSHRLASPEKAHDAQTAGRKHRSLTVPKYYAMRRFISASIAINTPRLSRKKWASCYVNPAPRSKSVQGLRLLRGYAESF